MSDTTTVESVETTEPTTAEPAPAETPTEPEDVAPKPVRKKPTTRAGRERQVAANRAKRAAKKAAGKPDTPPKGGARAPRTSPLRTRLDTSIGGIGAGLSVAGSFANSPALVADGAAVSHFAPTLAEALDTLAKNDPRVRAALERLLDAGAYGGIFAATLPLALAIMANHGMIGQNVPGMLGVPSFTDPSNVPSPPAASSGPLPNDAFGVPGQGQA